jgi:septal ring-binding cell division protein DamX
MDGENVRVKDRVELSLDGRQIASVVVGSLVLLGVVFVLGLNVGRQLTVRQFEATRGDALAALDQPPAPPPPREDAALTFHDKLTKERPPVEEPPTAAPPPSGSPAETLAAAAAAAAPPAPEAKPEAGPDAKAPPSPAAGGKPAKGAFAIQVTSTPSRGEAEKLAGKLKELSPRVEPADVPGKGRFYRVRVGAYGSKPEAEKALKGISAKVGAKAVVVASR